MRSSKVSLLGPGMAGVARPVLLPATPVAPSPTWYPSLDGLRALAIAIVFLNHSATVGRFPPGVTAALESRWIGLPGLGVMTFLVVSGFLITTILLRELDRTGTIDVPRFLLRRALRIFPAYFTFVAIVGLLVCGGVLSADGRSFAHAVTFTMNFAGGHSSWTLGHLWSMASQEQFYLLWPLVLVSAGRRRASHIAVATAIVMPVVHLVDITLWPNVARAEPFAFDVIAVGCALALYRDQLGQRAWFNQLVQSPIAIALVFAVGVLGGVIGTRPGLLTHPLEAIAVALLLERSIRHPWDRFGRLLNSRPMMYAGSVTFSLYLWQQVFLRHGAALASPLDVLAALAVGLASYYAIERPAAALWPTLERWLAMRRSAATGDSIPSRIASPGAALSAAQPRAAAGGA